MRLLMPRVETSIGIDVGSRCVKVAQASVRGGKIIRRRLASMDMPGNEGLTPAVAEKVAGLLARQGFTGQDVVLGVPPHLLRMEAVELPKVGGGAAHQLAEMEISRVTRLKNKTFEHGLWELPSPSRGGSAVHVMTVALPHADADKLCQPFLDAGLEVAALYPQVSAIASLVRQLLPADDQLQTIIDIGGEGTRLIILQRDNVLFHRAIPGVGLTPLEQTLRSELGVPQEVASHILRNVGTDAKCGGSCSGGIAHRQDFREHGGSDRVGTATDAKLHYAPLSTADRDDVIADRRRRGGAGVRGDARAATGREALVLIPGLFDAAGIAGTDADARSPTYLAALACALYGTEERS